MIFTSEDLLKFFGLKVGDRIKVWHTKGSSFEWLIYDVVIDEFENVMLNCELVHKVQISFLANREFEIIQPKLTLTEDEKVILRNSQCTAIGRRMEENECGEERECLYGMRGYSTYDFDLFRHMFKSIKIGERYSIEELLKENNV